VQAAWPGVAARRLDAPRSRIRFGESVPVEVAVKLNGLAPADVCVELLLARGGDNLALQHRHELMAAGKIEPDEERYLLELKPGLSGRLDYRIRVYPRHEALTHPFELGLTRWV
jgi:starch phosphorylase